MEPAPAGRGEPAACRTSIATACRRRPVHFSESDAELLACDGMNSKPVLPDVVRVARCNYCLPGRSVCSEGCITVPLLKTVPPV